LIANITLLFKLIVVKNALAYCSIEVIMAVFSVITNL
jgi:hypothetical protein